MSTLSELIKQSAVNAVNATYPVQVMFGRVIGTVPLRVYISQKMPDVGGGLLSVAASAVKNGLAQGDRVILLRVQGGQKFIILDKEA